MRLCGLKELEEFSRGELVREIFEDLFVHSFIRVIFIGKSFTYLNILFCVFLTLCNFELVLE